MQHKSQDTINRIVTYVEDFFKSNGYSPNITQIGKALGQLLSFLIVLAYDQKWGKAAVKTCDHVSVWNKD